MNQTKSFNFVLYSILTMLALAMPGNVCGLDVRLHGTFASLAEIHADNLKLSSVLKAQADADTDPTIIPEAQSRALLAKSLQNHLAKFFQWLAADPAIAAAQAIDAKNTLIPKLLTLTADKAANNEYIKNNLRTIQFQNDLTHVVVANFLDIACILDFAPAIKMALAKALAIDLYKNKQLNKTAEYDIEIINDPAKTAFTGLSDAAKGLVRYEYLLIFENLLDDGIFEIARSSDDDLARQQQNAHTLYVVRQLVQSKILPGNEADLEGRNVDDIVHFNNNLTQTFAQIFYNQQKLLSAASLKQRASNALLLSMFVERQYNPKFKDMWIALLPKHIQNSVSFELLRLNPKATVSFKELTEIEWTAVIGRGFIPNFQTNPLTAASFNNETFSASVKRYVDDYENWFVSDNKSNARLKALPQNFQREFKYLYRCKRLAQGKNDRLDGVEILIPTRYIRFYGISVTEWDGLNYENINAKNKAMLIDFLKHELNQYSEKKIQAIINDKINGADKIKEITQDAINAAFALPQQFDLAQLAEKLPTLTHEDLIRLIEETLKLAVINEERLKQLCQELLPDALKQIQVKLKWAQVGIIPTDALESLVPDEWEYLARLKRIPWLDEFTTYHDIALAYVTNLVGRRLEAMRTVLGAWKLANAEHKSEKWLKSLPEEFQLDLKRFYRGKMLNLDHQEAWLDRDEHIFENLPEERQSIYIITFQPNFLTNDIRKIWGDTGMNKHRETIMLWGTQGTHPNHPIDSLSTTEMKFLAEKNRIPSIDFENKDLRAVAKIFVEKFLYEFVVKSGNKIISNESLKPFPQEFLVAFARYYHCRTLKRSNQNLWLDGKETYIPIDYLNEYELTTYSTDKKLWQDLLIINGIRVDGMIDYSKSRITALAKDQIIKLTEHQPAIKVVFDKLKEIHPNAKTPKFDDLPSQSELRRNLSSDKAALILDKTLNDVTIELTADLSDAQLQELAHETFKTLTEADLKNFYSNNIFTIATLNEANVKQFYEFIIEMLVRMNQVNEKVAWAWAYVIPKESLTSLSKEEWQYLAEYDQIPHLTSYENDRQIAKEIVDKYSNPYFWNAKFRLTQTSKSDDAANWVKAIPESIQKEIAKYYQCLMINNKTPNRKLDNQEVNIPISYLVETGVLPPPTGKSVSEVKDMDDTSLATFYVNDLNKMQDGATKKFIAKIPPNSCLSIAQKYALSGNQKQEIMSQLRKQAGEFNLSFEDLLKKVGPQSFVKNGNTLDLSNQLITSITADDFNKFANTKAIKTLIIFNTLIKELPGDILTHLKNLETVIISDNPNLTVVPAKLFEINKKLKTIIISNNPKINPDKKLFEGVTDNLKRLALSGNAFTLETIPTIANLKVTYLDLSKNKLNNVPPLNNAIVELHLQNNQITSLESIKNLQQLQYLDASSNSIQKMLSDLCKLTKLEYLFLANNNGLSLVPEPVTKHQTKRTGAAGKEVEETVTSEAPITLPELKVIDVSCCNIADLKLAALVPKIITIIANRNKLSTNKYAFEGLKQLENLYLGRCGIMEINQTKFTKLDNLKVLGLEGNNITSLAKNTFWGAPNLEELYLFFNKLNTVDADAFNGLTSLKYLDISYNKLTNLTPKIFVHTPELQILNLKNNQLETIESYTFKLEHLSLLDLENNGIKDVGWWAFYGVPSNATIKFSGNNAVGLSKPLNSLRLTLAGGLNPQAASVDREWYNKYTILDGSLMLGSAAVFVFLPVLSIPVYATALAINAPSIFRSIIWRGTRATKNKIKSWFTKPTTPDFEFKAEWPNEKGLLEFKNLDGISTYFNKFHEEYHSAAIADKSEIIEIVEVGKQ
ncbi:MAG: Tyrosine-protein kinase Src42A [candidate division TM6 bacterium GW2011_GWF2_37_49]|nr:MAG: Tyrosine-protein kinase Src42A [candidate division TM6 bacterium GW2011_GWF2_37_49]